MAQKPPPESRFARAKATTAEMLSVRARLNQASAEFLKVDVITALTFCDIARASGNVRKKLRNRRHARQGYDTILHLIGRVSLTHEEEQYLTENLEKVRTELVDLGEVF